MKATALRLYGASDLRLEPVELEPAGEDAVLVEIVTNSICMSDWKAATLGTKHKRVPKDVATNPVMIGHEVCGVVREVGARWRDRYRVGQRVSVQPAFNLPGRELETMGYAWPRSAFPPRCSSRAASCPARATARSSRALSPSP